MRRQLTLFLPQECGSPIDAVRQRLDPRQHARIPAHVTLCRDDELAPWHSIHTRLLELAAFSLGMRFGAPQVLADGAILLRPTQGTAHYDRLRRSILGPHAKPHGAHITLLHPSHAAGTAYDLVELAQRLGDVSVTFRSIALIEQGTDGVWHAVQTYDGGPE